MLTKRHHRSLLAVISNMIVAIGMLLFALPMTGQLASNYRIKTIGKDQGLSNSAVMSLYRDDLGRIWIGTYDGLNLYNGITVKSFMSDGGQKSLLSNNIMLIDRAENNCLWLTTNLGLNRFSMSEQCVVGSYLSQHGGLRVFSYAWGNGKTWAIDDRGVYYYCSRHDHFVRTSLPYKHVDQNLSFVDKNNVLWLVFTNGDILKASAYNFNADDGKTQTSKVRIHALPFLYIFLKGEFYQLRAAALLAETNMSIGEILFETGFQSKAYFYKCFFARYGCTPKSYRAQKRVY